MYDTDHCEVVQVDLSVLGSAINCAVLALLDAGIAMRGVLVATTCVVYDDNDRPGRTVVVDKDETTNYEEDDDDGVVGSGRRGIAVLVTESSFLDNVHVDSDNGSVVVAMRYWWRPRASCTTTTIVQVGQLLWTRTRRRITKRTTTTVWLDLDDVGSRSSSRNRPSWTMFMSIPTTGASLSRCTPLAYRRCSTGCYRPSNVPARAAPRRWRHSLGSSSRGRCRARWN